MHLILIQFFLVLSLLLSSTVEDDNWPDWRGPRRDGTWTEEGIMKEFPSGALPVKWSASVNSGYSGPSIEGDRVYLTDRLPRPEPLERVLCFDAENGDAVWQFSYECEYEGIGYPAGPRASVIIDGPYAYSLGAMGDLYCFNKVTGVVIWHRALKKEYAIRMPIWGIASAPIIIDDKIILIIGGENNAGVIALDKSTGNELWRNLEDEAGYSAPILINQAGRPVLVVWTAANIAGMNPDNGEVFWKHEVKPRNMPINIVTPVHYENYIFCSSFYDGSILIELDPDKLESRVAWRRIGKDERNTDALHCCMSTPVILDDYIYGVDSYGEMRCLELMTGNRVWEDLTAVNKARWANIHFIQNGELTYMFNEHGELIIARLSKAGFKEISRTKLIEPTKAQLNRSGVGVTWSHPGFANKHVFVRSDKELVCVDLSVD